MDDNAPQAGNYLEFPFGSQAIRVEAPDIGQFGDMLGSLVSKFTENKPALVLVDHHTYFALPPTTPIKIHLDDALPAETVERMWEAAAK